MAADTLPKWLALPASRRRCSYLFVIFVILVIIYEFRTLLLPPVVYPLYESDQGQKLARPLSARDLLARPLPHDFKTLPKLIHQTWFPAGSNMSERAQVWVETMRAQNPDWEYVLWDDETDRMIVEQHFPWFLETYDKLPQEILRADVARNFYMYLVGGMYADVDTEALRPVEPLFLSHDTPLLSHRISLNKAPPLPLQNHPQTQRAFLGRMSRSPDLNSNAAVPNGWMASSPGHPFWLLPALHVLERADSGGDGSVEDLTGPGALQRMVQKYLADSKQGPGAVRRQVCAKIQQRQPSWSLFCDAEINDSLVLLPQRQIYPFSWVDDDVKACLAAFGNPEFDPEVCKREIDVEEWPSYFITYCTHSW
ncbi:glycosyltransferase family 32 protein [Aspergillus melleus]|uniref:glycosyltransferase family 32 protein n=1 Tax=Aspergillus melleus TaxID=138277 RepID=UPI001E8E66AE|nr:uncharacterized protein LDX57_004290 [Aspergillus melleus]KAH8426554.1 hypothetical protein LDX57_004290 [Aspergillus melleus]